MEICLNIEVIYNGNRQLSSSQESALGPYKYVGTSKNDTGGSGDPVYMKIQDDSDIVSIIHKYDIYGWQGWQCKLVSRSVILLLIILNQLLSNTRRIINLRPPDSIFVF